MRAARLALLGCALLGCARVKPGDLPRLRLGEDACARCGMIVSDERFAAGYVDADGKSIFYDDLGEFLAAAAERPDLKRVAFVHDAETGRWLPAREAVFVRIEALPTPMGSGYAAFADQAEASRYAAARRGS